MANYSSIAQLRSNVPNLEVAVLSDVAVVAMMDKTDDIVEIDIGTMIDFSLVTAADGTTTPAVVNTLAQFKTAERCLVAAYSAKRMAEQITDWQYWQTEYDNLVASVLAGEVDLGAFAGTTAYTQPHADTMPALGMDKYGGTMTPANRNTQRDSYGGEDPSDNGN